MKIALRNVAAMLGLKSDSDVEVSGWSVDSRTSQPGDLFFALRGPNFDGHAYVDEVFAKGAVAAKGAVSRYPIQTRLRNSRFRLPTMMQEPGGMPAPM